MADIDLQNLEDKIKESIVTGVDDALSFIPENAFTNAIGLPILKEGIADALKKSFLDDDTMQMFKTKADGLKSFIMGNLGLVLGVALGAALAVGIISAIAEATDKIGEEFDLTRERIRQLEKLALCRLRHPSFGIREQDLV